MTIPTTVPIPTTTPMPPTTTTPTPTTTPAPPPKTVLECVICLDKEPKFIFVPCGHKCICADCKKELMTIANREPPKKKCPVCRRYFNDIIEVYD
ncbi:hypothetical protein niasHS_005952 [Heterodera schachtii]|uniref:RING-type domain-containing protein n=1 Tax=Heterodera schachtii TaxID=97005 RepID=A0ABD2JN62_HETSC